MLRCYILRFSNRFRQIGRKTSHLCKICSGSFTNRRHPLVLLSDGNVEHVLLQLFVVLAQTLNDFALVVEPVCQIRMRFARLNGITSDILLRKLPHFFSQSLSGSFHRIDFGSRAFNYTVGIFSKQFDISHQRSQTIAHICDVFHDKLKRRIYGRSCDGQNLEPHVLQPTKLSDRRVHTDLFRFFSNTATFHGFKKLIVQIELRFQSQIERCSLPLQSAESVFGAKPSVCQRLNDIREAFCANVYVGNGQTNLFQLFLQFLRRVRQFRKNSAKTSTHNRAGFQTCICDGGHRSNGFIKRHSHLGCRRTSVLHTFLNRRDFSFRRVHRNNQSVNHSSGIGSLGSPQRH